MRQRQSSRAQSNFADESEAELSLLCVHTSLLCFHMSLLCVNMSLLCVDMSLMSRRQSNRAQRNLSETYIYIYTYLKVRG